MRRSNGDTKTCSLTRGHENAQGPLTYAPWFRNKRPARAPRGPRLSLHGFCLEPPPPIHWLSYLQLQADSAAKGLGLPCSLQAVQCPPLNYLCVHLAVCMATRVLSPAMMPGCILVGLTFVRLDCRSYFKALSCQLHSRIFEIYICISFWKLTVANLLSTTFSNKGSSCLW